MTFREKVLKTVSQLPSGKVTNYGFIAILAGKPKAARTIGWILSSIPQDSDIPWWRVINSKGYISIRNTNISKEIQKELLEKEGITVNENFMVDLNKYLWRPDVL